MMPIRVLVVDDHRIFREGLRSLLGSAGEVEVVAEASTSSEAVSLANELRPDVILMDLQLPGVGGIAATAQIAAMHDQSPQILVLTMHSDEAHMQQAIQAGARGYLLKDAEPESILQAIVAVHRGQMIFDRGMADHVITATTSYRASRPFPALTARETEILDQVARGLRNEAIAARTGLTLKTVQNNVSTIFMKLGAHDRAHAVALARDAGLGQPI